jgi:hypothetical protein
MAISGGPDIVEDGLVLHLDAADRNSYPGTGSTWYDLSGNGNHGTFAAGAASPTFSSDNGGSIVFGGDDYIEIPNCVDIGAGFIGTIEGCFEGDGHILSNNRPSTPLGEGYIRVVDSNLRYTINSRTGSPYTYHLIHSTAINITDNYFSVSLNVPSSTNSTLDMTGGFLLNGSVQNINTSTVFSGSHHNSTKIEIGRYYNYIYFTAFFTGKINFIRIYNKQLTEAEQTQNYNATKGRFGL